MEQQTYLSATTKETTNMTTNVSTTNVTITSNVTTSPNINDVQSANITQVKILTPLMTRRKTLPTLNLDKYGINKIHVASLTND